MKGNRAKRTSSISKATSYEEIGEFWDTHDLTDFEDQIREVDIETDIRVRRYYVSVDPGLMEEIGREAVSKGISSQSLVNLAIKEHLVGQRK